MTDSLIDTGMAGPSCPADPEATDATNTSGQRPAGLPDKFWDDKRGEVRLDALIKSYLELERKFGTLGPRDVPPSPDDYNLAFKQDLLKSDPDVNKQLHAAGFSHDQAQLVYDLACDRLIPFIAELASMFEADNQVERLKQHFGGEERWREVARQIDAWGRARMPSRVFDALATTFEGVIAMHRMMTGDEPGMLRDSQDADPGLSEASLKQMMRDPRYWRQQDPVIVEKVRDGFRRLYQDQ